MRYFYHPESDSLWTQEDHEPVEVGDGLSHEITKERYELLKDIDFINRVGVHINQGPGRNNPMLSEKTISAIAAAIRALYDPEDE